MRFWIDCAELPNRFHKQYEKHMRMFVNNVRDIGQCSVVIIIIIIIIIIYIIVVMRSRAPLLGLAKYIYYNVYLKLRSNNFPSLQVKTLRIELI